MRLRAVVACGVVAAAAALMVMPADASASSAPTPAVWCLDGYAGPPANHRFVARRRPSSCVLEIVAHRGDLAALNPSCCVTIVFKLRWWSWTASRAVGAGAFTPSVPAQGSRTRARVVLDRPRAGCLNGQRAPIVFTRARVYPDPPGTVFYSQFLPNNECFE
jgi:hypothetical protein